MSIVLFDTVITPNGAGVVLGKIMVKGRTTEVIVSHDPGRLAEGRPEQNPELNFSYPIEKVEPRTQQ